MGAKEDAEVVSRNVGLVPLDADAEAIVTTNMACALNAKKL